ncbi:MAG: hypothetical protein AAGD32_14925 [Planctomycetota bacterium]
MEWLERFKSETANVRPLIAQVATSADGGLPRCRSIVFRGWTDADGFSEGEQMIFVSDRRSRKNATLDRANGMEACFWIESKRVQWRIAGVVEVCGKSAGGDTAGGFRESVWRGLSDTARALFFWPASGEPRNDDGEFPETIDADTPIPETFEVLVLAPLEVDRLDLNPHPHHRRRWVIENQQFVGTDVNP